MIEAPSYIFEFPYKEAGIVRVPLVRNTRELRQCVQAGLAPMIGQRDGLKYLSWDVGFIPYNYHSDSMQFASPKGMEALYDALVQRGHNIPDRVQEPSIWPLRHNLVSYMRAHPDESHSLQKFIGNTYMLGSVLITEGYDYSTNLNLADDPDFFELITRNALAIDGDMFIADHFIPEGDKISNATIMDILEDIFSPYSIPLSNDS